MLTIREIPGGSVLERDSAFVAINSEVMRYVFSRIFDGWHGDVVTTGLGLGIAAQMLADMPSVQSVSVIEEDAEVCRLVQLRSPKMRTINADAWYWQPDAYFDFAFHDIWSHFPLDNSEEARLMHVWQPWAAHQVCLPTAYTEALNA